MSRLADALHFSTTLCHNMILQEVILAEPMDIEDVGKQASQRECCGYYAARKAQCQADLVLMPYNSLVHRCQPPTSAGFANQTSGVFV